MASLPRNRTAAVFGPAAWNSFAPSLAVIIGIVELLTRVGHCGRHIVERRARSRRGNQRGIAGGSSIVTSGTPRLRGLAARTSPNT
jgi:hypothetical protein